MQFWDTSEKAKEFDFNTEKKKLIDNLNQLHSMSVEEQTLYKKWIELQEPSMIRDKAQMSTYYDLQWKPTDINNKELTIKEIEELDPYVEIVENSKEATKWTYLRKMIHTMSWTANPGRNVKIFIKDRTSGKLLGLASLASDVTSMGVRDNYIGWSKEDKFKKGKLNYTSIASTIVCTQPLGYNFLGGKLVAMMITTDVVRKYWKKTYGQTLVGLGTTSLDAITNERIRNGENMGLGSGASGPVSGIKQKILSKIFKECGIKQSEYHHGFRRGVYLAMMYENGNEFLRSEIDESELVMKKKFEDDVEYINNWWKKKAIKRYTKLYEQSKLKPEHLFYVDGIDISWDEFKQKRLNEVGR